MGHYSWRFQDAMLPHVQRDLGSLELQALHLLREGLPLEIRRFVPAPMAGMTVGSMLDDDQVPIDDAGIREPLHEAGPVFSEDPIPAVPL